MTDLSKLPRDELKLPEFRGRKVHADKSTTGNFAYIEAEHYIPIAHQLEQIPTSWEYRRCTVDEIEQIAKMCRMVEEFIERHGGKEDG